MLYPKGIQMYASYEKNTNSQYSSFQFYIIYLDIKFIHLQFKYINYKFRYTIMLTYETSSNIYFVITPPIDPSK